jgi:SAM-dependent MidA family methyltransferase
MIMTLMDRIKRQIGIDGPLSVSDYMALCLSDPEAGYYTTATPFGREGDFITAPEISQMFGELIGIWCVAIWRNIGAPKRFTLVEMGPGRGTLMADLLRAASFDRGFIDALDVRMLEISGELRQQQKQALNAYEGRIEWVDDLETLGDIPAIFIGNEFLDALPFRQYIKKGANWHERMVALHEGELAWLAGVGLFPNAKLPADHAMQPEGAVFEAAPAREAIILRIGQHIGQFGGAGLLIDYGHLISGFGDTFQAVARHQFADVLKKPGKVDLTSHVDFAALERMTEQIDGVKCATISQGKFLLQMGLLERAGRLGTDRNKAEQETLRGQVERLAGPDQMGELFKAMMVIPSEAEVVGL